MCMCVLGKLVVGGSVWRNESTRSICDSWKILTWFDGTCWRRQREAERGRVIRQTSLPSRAVIQHTLFSRAKTRNTSTDANGGRIKNPRLMRAVGCMSHSVPLLLAQTINLLKLWLGGACPPPLQPQKAGEKEKAVHTLLPFPLAFHSITRKLD